MSPNKSPNDDTTPHEAAAPPPASSEVAQSSAATERSPRYSRNAVAAGVVGLLVAGLVGFGIGRATGDDHGRELMRFGQMRHGNGHGWGNQYRSPGTSGGHRQDGPRQYDGRFPPMPPGGPQDIQPNTPEDIQPDTQGG